MVSTVGSYMTHYAIAMWVWELTGEATAMALVGFFVQIPRVLISPIAGGIADRCDRKLLILIGDTMAALSTVVLLGLYFADRLQVWHFYIAGALNGGFGQVQQLAYTASISQMVPSEKYARASAMGSLLHYGSIVIAPALTGALYGIIHLGGVLAIDLSTFAIAFAIVIFAIIPQPCQHDSSKSSGSQGSLVREIRLGFRYIFSNSSLLALLGAIALFQLVHDIGSGIYSPMILARSGGNTRVFGSVASAAGLGGIIGAIAISVWNNSKYKIHGLLLGMTGAGLSKLIFGLGRSPLVWIPAQFCSSLNFPCLASSRQSLLMAKVDPNLQGRVFSIFFLIAGVLPPLVKPLAGLLADRVLEPAMMPNGSLAPIFGSIFGTGSGAGMALLYTASALCLMAIGLGGYTVSHLRDIDKILPDFELKSRDSIAKL